jgi:hypothetical protein
VADPWFNPNLFGALFGAIVGGGGGSLLGIWGGLLGTFGQSGKRRGLVFGGFYAFGTFGLVCAGFGVAALTAGQPFGIWYGPLLVGLLFTVGSVLALVLARRIYAAAEQRRLQAHALRNF